MELLKENTTDNEVNEVDLGKGLLLVMHSGWRRKTTIYRHGTHIKTVELMDKTAIRIFLTDLVELGADKNRIAKGFNISRQAIDNCMEIKKILGLEGLGTCM